METLPNTTTSAALGVLAGAMPARIQAIRTDYVVTPAGKSRRVLVVEAPGRQMPRIRLSDWESERDRALKELGSNFNLQGDAATAVITAAAELAQNNDLGAWLLRPAAEPDREISRQTFRGLGPLRSHPDLADAYEVLARTFPSSWNVKLTYLPVSKSMPNIHRRAWAAFLDQDGVERASISMGYASIQLRHHIQGGDDLAEHAQRRLGRWGHQVGIGLREFIAAFLAIELLSRYTEASKIVVEEWT